MQLRNNSFYVIQILIIIVLKIANFSPYFSLTSFRFQSGVYTLVMNNNIYVMKINSISFTSLHLPIRWTSYIFIRSQISHFLIPSIFPPLLLLIDLRFLLRFFICVFCSFQEIRSPFKKLA